MTRRPRWQPRLSGPYKRAVGAVLAVIPFVTGVDALTGADTSPVSVVEHALRPWVWGVVLVAASACIATGYLLSRPWISVAGLHISGAVFVALGAGVTWESIIGDGDWRGPSLYMSVGVLSWIHALGYADVIRGPRR